jgi:hypothetical protein
LAKDLKEKQLEWSDFKKYFKKQYLSENRYERKTKEILQKVYYRKCMTPISWDNLADRLMVGPVMLQEMENMVRKVEQSLKEAHDIHNCYADQKRRHLEFQVGEHVYLKVKARKSSLKLGNCAKLTPRFCGPFEILARMGPVAYQLALPANLRIHNVFHVSLLKKYIHDPTHMIDWNLV